MSAFCVRTQSFWEWVNKTIGDCHQCQNISFLKMSVLQWCVRYFSRSWSHKQNLLFNPFVNSGTYMCPTYKESFQVRWDNSIPLFLHASIYLELSVFRWTSQNAVYKWCSIAHSIICTRFFRGKMHSDWFNRIQTLQGRWQHGEKVGYCYPSGLEKTLCKWDIHVPLVTKGLNIYDM